MKTQINERTQWQIQNENNIQIRIVARKKRILDDDVVISANNIQRIGEIIAISLIKTVMSTNSIKILCKSPYTCIKTTARLIANA